MIDPKLINIGTKEKPILVPEDAVGNDSRKEERYWRGVATGSVLPSSSPITDQKALELLLKRNV